MSTSSQRSFSGGELTPSLYARTDISKYGNSLRTCRNHIILKHGGAKVRPGTEFIGEVKDSSKAVRLIPFNFSLTDNYMLEFGDLYMRVIKNGAYVYETATTITGITQANPGVVTTSAAHGYANGEEVRITGVVGMTELNGRNFKVNNVTATTFELQDMDGVNFDTSGLTAYVSGGSAERIYELTTTIGEANLFELNYVQNADVISLISIFTGEIHIGRTTDTNWSVTTRSISTGFKVTSGGVLTVSGASGTAAQWRLGAVDASGREGLSPTIAGADSVPTSGSPRTLSWTSVPNAVYYRLYRRENGAKYTNGPWGLVADDIPDGTTNTFLDEGDVQDFDQPGPEDNFQWLSLGSARAITYYQQRFFYGGGGANTEDQESVIGSEIGDYENFNTSYSPIAADQPFKIRIVGNQVNTVRHLLDLNALVIFTESAEMVAQGDAAGVITPTDINLRTQSYHGSGKIQPLIIDNSAIYVQARGSIIRDFQYSENVNGYSGNDLTIFATHLFENYTIADWSFDKVPNSIVWAARSDGTLLGMTYLKSHEVLAWHRHDFDGGQVESVATIPGTNEDDLYVLVNRTINGSTRRYVEKLSSAIIDDVVDVKRMDSYTSYDGRNTGSTTMTMTGGTTWAFDETLTLTASAAYFASSDVGEEIHITGADGTIIKFRIEGFTSSTVVTGKPQKTVPVAMRATAFTDWGKAIKVVTGLWHLEGKAVSSFSDGFVTSSPYNASYDTLTVTNGSITLDAHHVVIHVGLPFIADIETLDIDSSEGETARDKKHIVSQVNIFTEDARGLWVGPKAPGGADPLEDLYEIKLRDTELGQNPVSLKTEVVDVKIKSEWNSNGRVFIRQVDPVPATILSIMPEGNFTFRG